MTVNSYHLDFPTTIYGGTLDVTSGVLTVDRAMVVIDGTSVTVLQNGQTAITTRAIYMANTPAKAYGQDNFISDKFCYSMVDDFVGKASGRTSTTGVEFYLPHDVPNTSAGVNAWFTDNPTQLCYELATPFEITLTPTQISTLLGTNNIWSDAGDVSVDYRADTKLYIDNIHTPTDDDMTADAQIASGKYFLIGGNLYKSTTVIPAGDTIIPGTNCIKTNLAEALNALNA